MDKTNLINLLLMIKKRLSQGITWVGIAVITFGMIYYKDINFLIHEILRNAKLDDIIVDNLNTLINAAVTSIATYLVVFKKK